MVGLQRAWSGNVSIMGASQRVVLQTIHTGWHVMIAGGIPK
jgi:hypothetical protein